MVITLPRGLPSTWVVNYILLRESVFEKNHWKFWPSSKKWCTKTIGIRRRSGQWPETSQSVPTAVLPAGVRKVGRCRWRSRSGRPTTVADRTGVDQLIDVGTGRWCGSCSTSSLPAFQLAVGSGRRRGSSVCGRAKGCRLSGTTNPKVTGSHWARPMLRYSGALSSIVDVVL